MVQRDIRRIALIFGARHLPNMDLLDEVAAKGYHDVGVCILQPESGWPSDTADWETTCQIAKRAQKLGSRSRHGILT